MELRNHGTKPSEAKTSRDKAIMKQISQGRNETWDKATKQICNQAVMRQSNHGTTQSVRKQSTKKVIKKPSNRGTNQSEKETIMG